MATGAIFVGLCDSESRKSRVSSDYSDSADSTGQRLITQSSLKRKASTDVISVPTKINVDSSCHHDTSSYEVKWTLKKDGPDVTMNIPVGDLRTSTIDGERLSIHSSQERNTSTDVKFVPMKKVFFGTFCHEENGTLKKTGSDVTLNIPAGAVPKGKSYTIKGGIHVDLSSYNKEMKDENESIVSPIVEYNIFGGGHFEKPVEIIMPHCLAKGANVRVLHGEHDHFEEITNDQPSMSYEVKENFIHIKTRTFCKFLVVGKDTDIASISLSVAASMDQISEDTRSSQLRLLIHSKCAAQNDFSEIREKLHDPEMRELNNIPVTLCEKDEPFGEFPVIRVKLTIDESNWRVRDTNGLYKQEIYTTVMGHDVLGPSSRPIHKSEKLGNFTLRNKVDQEPVSCHFEVVFDYLQGDTRKESLDVIYSWDKINKPMPSNARTFEDNYREFFIIIAERLEMVNLERLAIDLDMIHELPNMPGYETGGVFEATFKLLTRWKQSKGCKATIYDLVTALKNADRTDIAEEVENKSKTI